MPKCQSCGGDNSPSATHCEYCDQPLGGRQVLEVAWSARTSDGASGGGRVVVEAPTGAGTERIRSLVEAAFVAAVDAEGKQANSEAIQTSMQGRLAAMLPANHTVNTITVDDFQAFVLVAGAVGEAASAQSPAARGNAGGRSVVGLGLIAVSLCCMASGALCLLGGMLKSQEAEVIHTAAIVAADQAAKASGLICVEGVIAQVSSAVIAPVVDPRLAETAPVATGIACLYVRESATPKPRPKKRGQARRDTRTVTQNTWVDALTIGALRVELDESTVFMGLETFPTRTDADTKYAYQGLRVDTKITVAGKVNNGIMTGHSGPGNQIFVSSAAGRDALAKELQSQSRFGYEFGGAALVVGILILLVSLVGFRRK